MAIQAINSTGTVGNGGKFSFTQNILSRRVKWALVDALNGGTAKMIAARTLYLPRDPKEEDEKYETRLSRSVLDNYYSEAVQQAVDKIFSRDIVLKNQPMPIQAFWNDVDGGGRDGNQFLKDVLDKAIHHGVSYILTDYPSLDAPFANLAEERAAAPTPYWVCIEAPTVIAVQSEVLNGREQLTFFQWEMYPTVLVDGKYQSIQEVRSFRQAAKGAQVEWTVERCIKGNWSTEEGVLDAAIPRIPVTAVYGNREGFFIGSPLFQSLAEMNVQHYALTSDLQNILHVANVPFLFGKGFGDPGMSTTDGRPVGAKPQAGKKDTKPKLEVDIHNAVMSTNPAADLKWIEHTGSAIAMAMQNITRLENRMKELGSALFTTAGSGTATATEKAINAAEANARLKSMALGLADAVEMAITYVAVYMNAPLKPSSKFEVNTSFSVDFVAESTFPFVLELYKMGALTWDALIAECKRRNIVGLDTEVLPPPPKPEPVVQEVVPPAVEEETSTPPNQQSETDITTETTE